MLTDTPALDGALAERLLRLQTDRRALEAEVLGVTQAQRMQIQLMESKVLQLKRKLTAEQRHSSSLVTNSRQAQLNRVRQEQSALMDGLETDSQRAAVIANRLDAAKETVTRLRSDGGGDGPARTAAGSFAEGAPVQKKMQRTQTLTAEAQRASAALRGEIDSLRAERAKFISKLEALEKETFTLTTEGGRLQQELQRSIEAREQAQQKAIRIDATGSMHSRYRLARRRQIEGQVRVVERQAKLARSKERESLSSAVASAVSLSSNSSALRNAWTHDSVDAGKEDGKEGGPESPRAREPKSLAEVVAVLAEMTGTDDDIELVAESLANTELENGARLQELNTLHTYRQEEPNPLPIPHGSRTQKDAIARRVRCEAWCQVPRRRLPKAGCLG